jgi:hypothetical protein
MSERLKWSQLRLLMTLGISYLLFAEAVSLLVSDGATCIVNPAKYGPYYADSNQCPPFHVFLIKIGARIFEVLRDPNWVIAIFTIVLAGSTIGLWLSTNRPWSAGEKQFRHARRTAIIQSRDMQAAVNETRRIGEAQVRAYIDIRGATVTFTSMTGILNSQEPQDPSPFIRITAKNTGQSPARNFVWNPIIQYIGITAETKWRTGDLGGNWREIRGVGISVGHEHTDGAIVHGMLLLKFLQESDVDTGTVIVRLGIQFEFEDVFDQRIADMAYFAGGFVRSPNQATQTAFGATEWSGKLSRIHKPNDWPQDQGTA